MATTPSQPIYKLRVEKHLPVRMRDGVVLYADVYRPDAAGRFPALVIRTPYDKSQSTATEREYFGSRGYLVIVQDTRGRYSSEGEFYPFVNEARDGYDTIQWTAALRWCDGAVGTVGQSYPGLVQYFAAGEAPPNLRACCPVSGPVSYFENFVYRRGVFELGWMLAYFVHMARDTAARKGTYERLRTELDSYVENPEGRFSPLKLVEYRHLPLADWGERLREGAPYFADYLRHFTYDDYWRGTDLRSRFGDFDIPMFHVGSWYDIFQYDTLAMYTGMRAQARSERARRAQKLLMGPWAHLLPYSIPTTGGTGEIDFGPDAAIELHAFQLPWFDYFLKGIETGVLEQPPVRIFVMGENRWRDEEQWPPARIRYTPLYLHCDSGARSLRGDGTLSFAAPADEPADSFVYDPENPVPTRGGTLLGLSNGVYDQREIEEREDVLVYTSETLDSGLEVTGPVCLILHAASSAPDTDFTAKLCDVRPDGYSQNIVEGVIRARFRESPSNPSPIVAGRVNEYKIDLWATSHLFAPGHRLRLEVSSSNFPRYDRNLNSGDDPNQGSKSASAHQTVFHDSRYPSHLLLPVNPR